MKPVSHETARKISQSLGTSLFGRHGYDAKYCAQRNLTGKTHYVDDDTLRFFHARIVLTRAMQEGLLFGLVESVAKDPDNRSRGFLFVVFDLFGTVLNDRDHADAMHNKSDKAAAAMAEWLESFDVLAHYKRAMLERAGRLKREAAEMSKAARAIRLPRKSKESKQ